MKEIVLISAYTPDTPTQDNLRELIKSLKDLNYRICLMTHTSTPSDIVDRCDYYVYDKDYHKFVRYAQSNGWYYKKRNISGFSTFVKDGEENDLLTKIRVPDVFKFSEDGFPYMDTFYYAQDEWAMNYEPEGKYFKLTDVEGGYEEFNSDYEEVD